MAYKGFRTLNTRQKRIIIALAALIIAVFAFLFFRTAKNNKIEYGKNLLIDLKDNKNAWEHDAYYNSSEISKYDISFDDEEPVLTIENKSLNDARFYQSLSVYPNTLYLLEGDILAKAQDGLGANLSIKDVYSFSDSVYNSNGEYKHIKLYGKTGSSQKTVTVFARLGGYSGEAIGSASFKNLKFSAVKSVPEGESIKSFEAQMGKSASVDTTKGGAAAYPLLILFMTLFAFFYIFIIKRNVSDSLNLKEANYGKMQNFGLVFSLLALSLLIRLYIAGRVRGYGVDIGCFTGWCSNLTQNGTATFYMGEGHSDYPPGYMLVLLMLGKIAGLFSLQINEFLVKLPPIMADIACIALILSFARKNSETKTALFLALIYALNPLILITGAGWGQVDSFTSLSLMLVVLFSLERKWSIVFPCFVLSVLLKPQALMFGPLGLMAIILEIIWGDKESRLKQLKSMLIGIVLALITFLVIALPFSTENRNLSWIFDLYSKTMNFYNKASVNSLNLYFLFGLNWMSIDELAPLALKLTSLAVISSASFICLYSHFSRGFVGKTKKLSLIAISTFNIISLTIISVLNVSLSFLGAWLMISCFLMLGFDYIDKRSIKNLPLFGALILIAFSNFGTMMHERYIYPAIALLCLDFIINKNKKSAYLSLLLTFTSFLNVGIVLDRGVRISGVEGHLTAPFFNIKSESEWLEYSISAVNTFITFIALSFSHTDAIKKLIPSIPSLKTGKNQKKASKALELQALPPYEAKRLDRRDAAIVIVLTLCYAFLAFFRLGATDAPQSYWKSENSDKEIVFDLGEERNFKILIYPGIIHKKYSHNQNFFFRLDTSVDGESWIENDALLKAADCFTWQYHKRPVGKDSDDRQPNELVHHGRYIKMHSFENGLEIMELQFRDNETADIIRPKAVKEFELKYKDLQTGKLYSIEDAEKEDIFALNDKAIENDERIRIVDHIVEKAPEKALKLIDEADKAPKGEIGWYNSMYFDEIYHARTGLEQARILTSTDSDSIYETTHPPLGKVLMTFSIMTFGMTPFGWRFAGALSGVLMLPGIYLIARLFSKRRESALLALSLIALDFMHYTQTRIATIDSFATLFIIWASYFMFRYVILALPREGLKKQITELFFSGVFFGLACASKWTGFYAGLGLALIFFTGFLAYTLKLIKQNAFDKKAQLNALITIAGCVLIFVVVPFLIYALSFYPVLKNSGGLSIRRVIEASESMLSYHAKPGFGMDHPFYSPWYAWPLSQKPMWYYSGKKIAGTGSTILAFGNPIVWGLGLIAIIAVAISALKALYRKNKALSLFEAVDIRAFLILISFAAQYLPWALVPRGTYIYHYFPSTPFIILSISYIIDKILINNKKAGKIILTAVLLLSLAAFIIFFPYISGFRVPLSYLELGKWFPTLYY